MSSTTAAPHRTGPLPASVQSAVRGAARAVAATVGAVLAGLVLALPTLHLPPPGVPAGVTTTVVAGASFGHLPLPNRAATSLLAPAAPTTSTVLTAVREVRTSVAVPVVALRERVAGASAVAVVPALGAAAVVLAAALVGARPAGSRRRASGRPTHLGPAPLRGPPRPPAPAP